LVFVFEHSVDNGSSECETLQQTHITITLQICDLDIKCNRRKSFSARIGLR